MPPRAWRRWMRSVRGPRSAPERGGSGRRPSAPTPQAAASRSCSGCDDGRTVAPGAPDAAQAMRSRMRTASGNTPVHPAGPAARPSRVPPPRQCSVRPRPRRRAPRGHAAPRDRCCGSASTCHSNAATSSSVAVSASAIASWPRYSSRPPSMRVIAEARIGSPQLIVEAATARRLRPLRLRSASRRDIGRVVQAAPGIVRRGDGADPAAADIGVQRLAGHAEPGGGLFGGQPAAGRRAASSGMLIHLIKIDDISAACMPCRRRSAKENADAAWRDKQCGRRPGERGRGRDGAEQGRWRGRGADPARPLPAGDRRAPQLRMADRCAVAGFRAIVRSPRKRLRRDLGLARERAFAQLRDLLPIAGRLPPMAARASVAGERAGRCGRCAVAVDRDGGGGAGGGDPLARRQAAGRTRSACRSRRGFPAHAEGGGRRRRTKPPRSTPIW